MIPHRVSHENNLQVAVVALVNVGGVIWLIFFIAIHIMNLKCHSHDNNNNDNNNNDDDNNNNDDDDDNNNNNNNE